MLTDRAGCYNVREKKHCTPAYLYRQFLRNCHLPRVRRRSTLLAIVIYINTISGISNDYNGFTTSEIALTFTIPAYKDKRSAARDGDNGVSGISNDYNGFTTPEIAPYVHFPRARGKYRRSRG